ncbi:MAG: archaellin/type IV pilin N-terminal domain-containing protein [Thermoplasmatota archaeon]
MRRVLCERKGVSPVIAVILMVAITIVLAGVVFIWAQSFADEVREEPDYYNVRVSITTDEGSPPTQLLRVELLEGRIHWSSFSVKVDDVVLAISTEEDRAGDQEIFAIPDSSASGIDISVGSSYVVKIISLDYNSIVYNDEIICTRAL